MIINQKESVRLREAGFDLELVEKFKLKVEQNSVLIDTC